MKTVKTTEKRTAEDGSEYDVDVATTVLTMDTIDSTFEMDVKSEDANDDENPRLDVRNANHYAGRLIVKIVSETSLDTLAVALAAPDLAMYEARLAGIIGEALNADETIVAQHAGSTVRIQHANDEYLIVEEQA